MHIRYQELSKVITPDINEQFTEAIARTICQADGVDPEHTCYGMGRNKPKGWVGPAWEVRVPQAKAVISLIRKLQNEPDF